mgnify:CR=1 FL=1
MTLEKFFRTNKSSYVFPKTRDIKYIEIKPSDFHDQVKITKKQIDDKYEIDKSKYITAEKREIYQITSQEKNKVEKKIIVKVPNTEEAHRAAWCMGSVDLVKERKEISPTGSDKEMTMGVKTTFGFQIFFYQNPPDLKVNEVEILDLSFRRGQK